MKSLTRAPAAPQEIVKGISLVFALSAVGLSGVAGAAPITVDSSEKATRVVSDGQSLEVKATGKIDPYSGNGVNLSSSGLVSNAGLIRGTTLTAQAISVTLKGAKIDNASTGKITSAQANGIQIGQGLSASTISNSGTISATKKGDAIVSASALTLSNAKAGKISSATGDAVHISGGPTRVASGVAATKISNSGAISASVNGNAVRLEAQAQITNEAGGKITSAQGRGISVDNGGAGSTIDNSGEISGAWKGEGIFTSAPLTLTNNSAGKISSSSGDAVRFVQTSPSTSALSVNNSGVITAYQSGTAVYADGPLKVNNQATGLINSAKGHAIYVSGTQLGSGVATATITNAGRIVSGSIVAGVAGGSGNAIVAVAPVAIVNNEGGSIISDNGTAVVLSSTDGKASSLINAGTIQGGAADGSGNAIVNSGKGALSVKNSGSIIGTIKFGNASADSLTVTGGTINGAIKGSGANDTVTYKLVKPTSTFKTGAIAGVGKVNLESGTVTFDGAVTDVKEFNIAKGGHAVLQTNLGVGAVNNSGLLHLASNYVIDGNYNQLTGGKLQIDIGAASAGSLTVTGAATFASRSAIYAYFTKPVKNGQSFTILNAGSAPTLASAATSMFVTNNVFLKMSPVVSGTSLSLLVGTVPAAKVATTLATSAGLTTTPVALKSLVSVLDNLNASASSPASTAGTSQLSSNEFYNLSMAISSLQGDALLNAIKQTQSNPSVLGGVLAGSLNAGNSNIDAVGDRLARARADYYPASASAYRSMAGLMADAKVNVWGQALNGSNQPIADGNGGYRPGTAGLIMGSDAQLSRNVRVGAAFGMSQTAVDGRDSALPGNARLQSYQGTLYATRDFGNAYVEGQLGYAYNDTRTLRVIEFAQRVANASFGGSQSTVRVGSGYRFMANGWHLTPNAHLQYARLSNNGYSETDAGALNLSVERNRLAQAQGALGLRAAYPVATANGFFTPELRISLLRNLNPQALQTHAFFSDGSTAFSSTGVQAGRSGVNLGMNVSYVAKDGLKLMLGGDYVRSGEARAYSTTFKLSSTF
ncbi:MAG: autotransporter domain-containing protein [Burkholderiaceae bacterium]|nr:autotransporter domain-containing protein [Burkholderiaceae bacterium]